MNDLKNFKHGEEGTHSACKEMIEKFGGKTLCCTCVGHDKCVLYTHEKKLFPSEKQQKVEDKKSRIES